MEKFAQSASENRCPYPPTPTESDTSNSKNSVHKFIFCILNLPHLFINPPFSGPRWKHLLEICSFMLFKNKYLITWSLFSIFPLSCYVLRNFGTDFSKLHLLDKIMFFSVNTCVLRGRQSAAQPMAHGRQLISDIEILSKNNWDGWSFQIRYHTGRIFYTPLLENQTKTYTKNR